MNQSFMEVFSKVAHRSFPHTPSVLLVDMDEDNTCFQFMHLGKLGSAVNIPFGMNSIIRNIENKFNLSPGAAHSHLSLFLDNSLDFKTTRGVDEVLTRAEREFRELWDKTEHFKVDSPHPIFLVVEPPFERVAKTLIGNIHPNTRHALTDHKRAVLEAFSNLSV